MSREGARSLWSFGLIATAAIGAWTFLAFALGQGFAIPTGVLGIIGSAVVLLGPVGKALGKRILGESSAPPDEVLADLEDLRARVLELEERVDFSERLLAQSREPSERQS